MLTRVHSFFSSFSCRVNSLPPPSAFLLPELPSSHQRTLSTHESPLLLTQICPAIFHIFFLSCFCGNNEAEGTCFLQAPYTSYSHYTSRQHVCELAAASWRWWGAVETPAELSHPLSSPLPAPWWVVASWAYCPCSDKHWKSDGTFQPSPPSTSEKKNETYDIDSHLLWPMTCQRDLPANQFTELTKSLSEKRSSVEGI